MTLREPWWCSLNLLPRSDCVFEAAEHLLGVVFLARLRGRRAVAGLSEALEERDSMLPIGVSRSIQDGHCLVSVGWR
jgi:hypothetical protein